MTLILLNLAIIFGALVLTLILAATVSRPTHLAVGAYRKEQQSANALDPSARQRMFELSGEQLAQPAQVIAAGMQ